MKSKTAVFDVVASTTLGALMFSTVSLAGLGNDPLLIAAIVLGAEMVALWAYFRWRVPYLTVSQVVRISRNLFANDFVVREGDNPRDRWWHLFHKRSWLKWLAGTSHLFYAAAFVWLHPFVVLVAGEMWLLAIIPVLTIQKVGGRSVHHSSQRTTLLFGLGVAAAAMIGLSQHLGGGSSFPLGWETLPGVIALAATLITTLQYLHRSASAGEYLEYNDEPELLEAGIQAVGAEHAVVWQKSMLALIIQTASNFLSFVIVLGFLLFCHWIDWFPFPVLPLHFGGVLVVIAAHLLIYPMASLFWYRSLCRESSVSPQSIQSLYSLMTVLFVAGFSVLSNIGDNWFAPLTGLKEINYPIFLSAAFLLVAVNVAIHQQDDTTPTKLRLGGYLRRSRVR